MLNNKIFKIFILVLVLTSCASSIGPIEPNQTVNPVVTEIGNWTYITFDEQIDGGPSQNTELIGSTILYWEATHPDREIVSTQIIYSLRSYGWYGNLEGVSFYSQPTELQQ